MKVKRFICAFLVAVLLLCPVSVSAFASSATATVVTDSDPLNMRSGPGTSYDVLVQIPKGATVTVLEQNGDWWKVTYSSYTGYVSSSYLSLTSSGSSSSSSAGTITTDVPAAYASYISKLKAAHPNWNFEFYYTGLSWSDVIENETTAGKNLISGNVISYRSTSHYYDGSKTSLRYGTVNATNGTLNLRSKASTDSDILAVLPNGTSVTLVGKSGNWYYVSCNYGGTEYMGYLSSNYVSGVTGTTNDDVYLRPDASTSQNPITTIPSGANLSIKKISGNWYYVSYASYTGYVYYSYVDNVFSSYGYTAVESGTWYQAHGQVVQYYMDPRNFLSESTIFQFEKLSFDDGSQTLAGVESILNGSFMDGQTVQTTDGRTISYAEAIYEAGKTYGVSPYHLASRILQEVGKTSPSAAATGSGSNGSYVGIYNFYNIGANTGMADGLKWASNSGSYGRPWDTPYKSIMGGAQYIANGYINIGQNTLYTQKFNVVVTEKLYNHQYMANVQAPSSEAAKIYSNYKDINALDSSFTFIIPVYENMPSAVCQLPAASASPNLAKDTDPVDSSNTTVVSKTVSMFRLYNPNSGEHFYTMNSYERDNLVSLGWTYEGIGWTAPNSSSTPVYRLYNSQGGEHHYTINVYERDNLVSLGWTYEGIGWYSDDNKSVPIYRQYNPNAYANNHNYTMNENENNWLVSLGWQAEGIGWYGA